MEFGLASYSLALAAGSLSTLSPCVLPLVPILLASAVAAHRLGPYALAGGLALSFTVVGVFVASLGAALGLDQGVFRLIAASLLIAFGVVLLSARLQERFAVATSGLSGAGNTLLASVSLNGLSGQFMLGLLLGIVWSPCVGPTLGAAVTLASQGQNLGQVTLLMALFGIWRGDSADCARPGIARSNGKGARQDAGRRQNRQAGARRRDVVARLPDPERRRQIVRGVGVASRTGVAGAIDHLDMSLRRKEEAP
ncbi:hypothetical protein SKTS_22670 [Sulfurimicrobium lacus]|uniref:Cytochrome C biogenesis protein transmembrane domain-containing protein n=1 Tax=Sulfurimicrobium lacus TaxID=2715678 RepID=A0A6F8VDZ3_9PROT|nr:cytochrome c biogenesis CcdA family protein [Sulfurimicrobium lacus]BCB27381.1 hypothetical protein SKTS_22670 [Sulfurimicrobium lacus]